MNDFGKETLILQACYKKIDELERQLVVARTALADITEHGEDWSGNTAAKALITIVELKSK